MNVVDELHPCGAGPWWRTISPSPSYADGAGLSRPDKWKVRAIRVKYIKTELPTL